MFKTKFQKIMVAGIAALLFSFSFLAGMAMKHNNAFAQTPAAASSPVAPAQNNLHSNGTTLTLSTNPSGTAVTPSTSQPGADSETNDGPDQNVNGQEAPGTETQDGAETADNSPVLKAQAKITVDQAKQAALAQVPGTVVSATLEDENGTAVYSVIVNSTNGSTAQDVKVDAATGKILKTEAGNDQQETGGQGEQEDGGSDTVENQTTGGNNA